MVLTPAQLRARTIQTLAREKLVRTRVPVSQQQRQQQFQREAQARAEQERVSKFEREIGTVSKELGLINIQLEKLRERGREDIGLQSRQRSLNTQLRNLNQGLKAGAGFGISRERGKQEAKAQRFVVAAKRGFEEVRGLPPVKQPAQIREQRVKAGELSLVFAQGELVAVRDERLGQSRPISQFEPIIRNGKVVGVEDLQLRQSRVLDKPVSVEVTPRVRREIDVSQIPTGTFTASETNIEQLTRNIRESVPELEFIPTKTLRTLVKKSLVSTGIPALVGVKRFAISKFKQGLANPTGAFQFRVDQAEAIGNLADEIVTGFVAGKGVGKGLTLIRGAGSQFLPTTLKQAPKFKKTISALQVAGVVTLTTAAGISVKKAFERGGTDAGVLALIGLTSFGKGFATTGLKTSAQAQREFKETADLFKQLIPKGKKGEARFDELGRFFKKKKSPFAKLEELDRKAVQEASNKLASIEKRLANAKNIKEQLRILAEIKSRLKTQQQKDNFNIFVKGLIEKEILRPARFEIKKGIFVAGVKKPTLPRALPTKRASVRNQQRTKRNQKRNQKRISRSKLPLGVRFKEAQQQTSRQRQDSKLKQAQEKRTAQKERLSQATTTTQAQRLRQLQRQRSGSRQALKGLLKTSLKVGAPIPFGLPKKKKKIKVKKVRVIPFKETGESFSVFVRKRGKEKLIGSGLQENRAKRLLSNRLDNTLRASGRIVGSEKEPKFKKDIGRFDFPSGKFRPPVKKSKLLRKKGFIVVEKRKFRLDSPQERRNIQKQRKIKRIKPIKLNRV